MQISNLQSWLPSLKQPLIIAGPCGAESYEQVIETAKQLHALNKISLFRAGVWKPRTRPNAFEGRGEEALKWLQEVQKQFNLKTTVEVANAQHVELALKYKVDVLWIGARTTVNPFSVQEIADVLKGVNIPVMITNPLYSAQPKLYIGNPSTSTSAAAISAISVSEYATTSCCATVRDSARSLLQQQAGCGLARG